MPRNTGGFYQLPQAPVQNGTTIDADQENVFRADIKDALTDSLSRSGFGGMQAPFRLYDGGINLPGLAFVAETTLGLWRPAPGVLGVTKDGTELFRFSQTGHISYKSISAPSFTTDGLGTFADLQVNGDANIDGSVQAVNLTVTGSTEVLGQLLADGGLSSRVGGPGLMLKPGTADHVYLEFYARTAAPAVRSGFIGYSSSGATLLTFANAVGNIAISATSGYVLVADVAPAATVAVSKGVTSANGIGVRATVLNDGTIGTTTLRDGYNLASSGSVSVASGNLRITFGSAFADTNYTVSVASDTAVVWNIANKTTTRCDVVGYRMNFSGGAPANTFTKVVFGGLAALDTLEVSFVATGRQ